MVDGPVPDLRRRLYALKDEIGKTNDIISCCVVRKVFFEDRKALHEIQVLQARTFRALGIVLSNHGSDWIEQTIAGGLSYTDFTNLESQDIQAFEKQVSAFGRALEDRRWASSYEASSVEAAKPRRSLSLSEQRYDGANDTPKGDKLKGDNADFVPAALDCEGVKAMLLKLNSMLKVQKQ